MQVRPPAVAGSSYPGNPGELSRLVDRLLDEAAPPAPSFPVHAVIAPHAGYVYSGPIAASAFKVLRDHGWPPRRVVVIGPAHYIALRGIAVPGCAAFRTPLGEIALDAGALADLPGVVVANTPHAPEHAIEVELPFLQRIFGRFALVPLVVGDATPAETAAVLAQLWQPDTTAIVVSSDLSHYLDDATARRRDAETAQRIEAFAGDRLGPDDACGHLPVAGLLALARRHGLQIARLDLRNSGDTAGDRRRVVGYGAWALGGPAA
jgi:AmmeMemoRadiSam system protein B